MRRWFLQRKPREQMLLAGFVLLGALVWCADARERLRHRLEGWRSSRSELAVQQLWLDQQEAIHRRSAEAVKNLDPTRTYDATRLVATITSLAARSGLSPVIDPPVTQQATQFAYHQIRVSFQRAGLPALLQFSDEVARQAPYLSVEQIALQADRGTSGELGVTLQISAAQLGAEPPR